MFWMFLCPRTSLTYKIRAPTEIGVHADKIIRAPSALMNLKENGELLAEVERRGDKENDVSPPFPIIVGLQLFF